MRSNLKNKSFFELFFETVVFKSWWVIIFFLISFVFYDRLAKEKSCQIAKISSKLCELNCEKREVLAEKNELLLQLNSQSDPEWIELVLMKKLGVVPEGYYKIQFKKS